MKPLQTPTRRDPNPCTTLAESWLTAISPCPWGTVPHQGRGKRELWDSFAYASCETQELVSIVSSVESHSQPAQKHSKETPLPRVDISLGWHHFVMQGQRGIERKLATSQNRAKRAWLVHRSQDSSEFWERCSNQIGGGKSATLCCCSWPWLGRAPLLEGAGERSVLRASVRD